MRSVWALNNLSLKYGRGDRNHHAEWEPVDIHRLDAKIEAELYAVLVADPFMDQWHVSKKKLTHCSKELRQDLVKERSECEDCIGKEY